MKRILDNFEEYILFLSLAIMTIITVANVFSRKVLQASWSFTEEITTNLFILNTLLASAVAAKKGSHMGLTVVTDLLPKKYEKYIKLITLAIAFFFCGFLFKYGVDMVAMEIESGQTTASLGWPEWIFGIYVPIGAALILIRFIQNIYLDFRKKEGEK